MKRLLCVFLALFLLPASALAEDISWIGHSNPGHKRMAGAGYQNAAGADRRLSLDSFYRPAGFFSDLFSGGKTKTVGGGIAFQDITDFYYTVDSSAYPPQFQRYRIYAEGGQRFFHHETREGDHWPLTEDDITVSGTVALTSEQWDALCDLLRGGTAQRREETLIDGDDGPWVFIYWNGGEKEGRAFTFESLQKHAAKRWLRNNGAGLDQEQIGI